MMPFQYTKKIFVDRPRALDTIHNWLDSGASGKAVLTLAGPPGCGKTWILRNAADRWNKERLILWLDAPNLINLAETQEPSRMINVPAFDAWFEEAQRKAKEFCNALQPIGEIASFEARLEALVRMLCDCSLRRSPLLIVDGYDEIPDFLQAQTFSLRFLEKFIGRPCTRLVIACRSAELIQGDTLRRNQQVLYLVEVDPLSADFAAQQFKLLFQQNYGGHPMPDAKKWMRQYQYYRWDHPFLNAFLFERGLQTSPSSLRQLTDQDFYDCIQESVRRAGHYPPLTPQEFETLYHLATELNEEWSYWQAEDLLEASFYTHPHIHRLLELGLIIWYKGLFYHLGAGIRELLREIKEIPSIRFEKEA